jgi:hypothetical protein
VKNKKLEEDKAHNDLAILRTHLQMLLVEIKKSMLPLQLHGAMNIDRVEDKLNSQQFVTEVALQIIYLARGDYELQK